MNLVSTFRRICDIADGLYKKENSAHHCIIDRGKLELVLDADEKNIKIISRKALRKYHDEDKWEAVPWEEAMKKLEAFYRDVSDILDLPEINTPYAIYTIEKAEVELPVKI